MTNKPEYIASELALAKVKSTGHQYVCGALDSDITPYPFPRGDISSADPLVIHMSMMCIQLGVVSALLNYNIKGKPLSHSLHIAEAKLILFDADHADVSPWEEDDQWSTCCPSLLSVLILCA